MLTERFDPLVGVLNGELWALGGCDSTYSPVSSCERLDASGTWVPGPDMLWTSPCSHVVVLHGELWVFGLLSTQRLDMATNRWIRCTHTTPNNRDCYVLAVFKGQLWAVGGIHDGRLDTVLSSCQYLDTPTNTWIEGPRMNTPRYGHGLAVLDGQLWAVGGNHGGDHGYLPLVSCERLDSTTNSWVAGPDLPVGLTTYVASYSRCIVK